MISSLSLNTLNKPLNTKIAYFHLFRKYLPNLIDNQNQNSEKSKSKSKEEEKKYKILTRKNILLSAAIGTGLAISTYTIFPQEKEIGEIGIQSIISRIENTLKIKDFQQVFELLKELNSKITTKIFSSNLAEINLLLITRYLFSWTKNIDYSLNTTSKFQFFTKENNLNTKNTQKLKLRILGEIFAILSLIINQDEEFKILDIIKKNLPFDTIFRLSLHKKINENFFDSKRTIDSEQTTFDFDSQIMGLVQSLIQEIGKSQEEKKAKDNLINVLINFNNETQFSLFHNSIIQPNYQKQAKFLLKALLQIDFTPQIFKIFMANSGFQILHFIAKLNPSNKDSQKSIPNIVSKLIESDASLHLDSTIYTKIQEELLSSGLLKYFCIWIKNDDIYISSNITRVLLNLVSRKQTYLTGINVVHPQFPIIDQEGIDIVFVHGLKGNFVKTWRGWFQSGNFWIQSLLPKDINKSARIVSVSVKTFLGGWGSEGGSLQDMSLILLQNLQKAGIGKNRPVIFVSHSLGGLVVKELVVSAQTKYPYLFRNIRGCVFYSTPHFGMSISSQSKYFELLFGPNSSLNILTDKNSLISLNKKFGTLKIPTLSFAESKSIIPGIIVVSPQSANPGFGKFILTKESHRTISKHKSRDDPIYQELITFINENV
ncbi:hypothetical protein M0811_04919 [Anaeramoeba ignava]|uniref:DUF676 domain-containing protein n=1 Tax=Anaeramoeba ignava TaxID=1746090 RepID=A0A9Q0RFY4_ANAIG|nr:hypothetical protein M0811_04919 [Anaeramoeba ignava]